ncbi:MAG: UvrD-helicase domain-containing protein [Bacteroidia bacterium]|nr:UvrD-helicase domain-containing protein [Bacteroidia bacterium]
MGEGTLTIYSASAGSGKTFNLTRVYLTRLFRSGYGYRRILAVTFTNKATAEMKSRILDQLYLLSNGGESDYLEHIIKDTGSSEEEIRNEAGEILFAILHDFSRFSVCTIDAFFQKILRAFTREAGLHSGFNIELDHSLILSTAVDEMIASSATDSKIRNWLIHYVMANLEEEKSWDLKGDIMKLAEELFREKFRILSEDERTNLENKEFLLGYIRKIHILKSSIEGDLVKLGKKCEEIFNEHGLTDDMFYQKGKGIPGFIRSLAEGSVKEPNSYVLKILEDPPKWSTGKPAPPLQEAIAGGLESALIKVIGFCNTNIINYRSADTVLSNIYALGILSDVLKRVHQVASSENSFLLSEAGEVLSLITGGEQTPFIYEKIGNIYENYMIDEFQDTSWLQWKNFHPLINESMARGCDNLVVGDIKQSIYRWRNSDLQILAGMKDNLVDGKRFLSKPLVSNWRSRSNIIRFNNSLFSVIPALADKTFSENSPSSYFRKLYSEAVQLDAGNRSGGYVRIEFLDDEKENGNEDANTKSSNKRWQDIVLEKLPCIIESFQDKGYKASDIGIIVREGRDGEAVVGRMIEYAGACTPEKKNRYNYNIVSSDSLSLSASHALTFIISAIKVLDDPEDMISRAQMVRFLLMATGNENADRVPLFSNSLADNFHGCFPDGFEEFMEKARQLTLFEATESIIGFFGLGRYSSNVAYLDTFQDLVLGFSGSKSADFKSFLEWWETTGKTKSVILPANQDAARVFTIHKSKGLEFRIVILPFISWNLDHKASKSPILWVKPEGPPFNELGIVPVRYGKALADTIFVGDFNAEKCSVYIDNINLLYVAMTRAMDAIVGFAPESHDSGEAIAGLLKDALTSDDNPAGKSGIFLKTNYDAGKKIFEFGVMPENKDKRPEKRNRITGNYIVSRKPEALRLKLHGENYFSADRKEKINYGKLMHMVFESISSSDDIPSAVRRLVLEGMIVDPEAAMLEEKLQKLISTSPVSEWFKPGINVMKEAGILMPSGHTRRPDRIILRDNKTIIIDFKFGEENSRYTDQVRQYRKLLTDMGYKDIEAYLWYVDKNKIVNA